MGIFRALGFGVFLLVLRLMVPEIFHEGQHTAVLMLHGAGTAAETASTLAASAGQTRLIALPPYPLPQAPDVHHF